MSFLKNMTYNVEIRYVLISSDPCALPVGALGSQVLLNFLGTKPNLHSLEANMQKRSLECRYLKTVQLGKNCSWEQLSML